MKAGYENWRPLSPSSCSALEPTATKPKPWQKGVYGKRPQGESMDYWRGRRDLAYELAAFMHPTVKI